MTIPESSFPEPAAAGGPAKKSRSALIPQKWKSALIVPGVLVLVMLVLQIVNQFTDGRLAAWGGIRPRSVDSLVDVLTAPLMHGGWGHLLSNAVPLMIFGFLLMVNGPKQFIAVTVLVWLISGLGIWITAGSNSLTVGFSGVIFGWLAYLIVHGFFLRDVWRILLGVALLVLWGGMLWGVLPTQPGVSWQGHLFGAIGGVLAAWLVSRADGTGRARAAAKAGA